jgi:hypothetical protein
MIRRRRRIAGVGNRRKEHKGAAPLRAEQGQRCRNHAGQSDDLGLDDFAPLRFTDLADIGLANRHTRCEYHRPYVWNCVDSGGEGLRVAQVTVNRRCGAELGCQRLRPIAIAAITDGNMIPVPGQCATDGRAKPATAAHYKGCFHLSPLPFRGEGWERGL